jgi:hypothetical protein
MIAVCPYCYQRNKGSKRLLTRIKTNEKNNRTRAILCAHREEHNKTPCHQRLWLGKRLLARDCHHETYTDRIERHSSPTFRRIYGTSVQSSEGKAMNIDATTSTASVDAAIIYLASRDALDKLATPTPVLYGNVVMMPVIGK